MTVVGAVSGKGSIVPQVEQNSSSAANITSTYYLPNFSSSLPKKSVDLLVRDVSGRKKQFPPDR